MRHCIRGIFFIAAALAAAAVCQADGPAKSNRSSSDQPKVDLRKVRIFCETNRSALSYRENEEMVFTFRADFGGVAPQGYFLSYVRRGDDDREFSGKATADETLVVKTSLDRPGFVSVTVKLTDAQGKEHNVAFYAGAAVKPETLEDCGEPADFDAFWKRQRARLDAVPFLGKVTETPVGEKNGVRIYAVSIPCVGRPATGYLTVPADAKAKSLPAEIVFDGYGAYKQPLPPVYPKGRILLRLNAHGQELGRDGAYYKEFFRSIRSNGFKYAHDPEQNKDPETTYFNGMALRALRGVEYLKTRPEWNGRDLEACGTSQGGLQTMWVAALDPAISYASATVTWCCDLAGGTKAGRFTERSLAYRPALDYYDPALMPVAPRSPYTVKTPS